MKRKRLQNETQNGRCETQIQHIRTLSPRFRTEFPPDRTLRNEVRTLLPQVRTLSDLLRTQRAWQGTQREPDRTRPTSSNSVLPRARSVLIWTETLPWCLPNVLCSAILLNRRPESVPERCHESILRAETVRKASRSVPKRGRAELTAAGARA